MAQIAMDGAELFSRCMEQATLVVKQVLPSHYANATPDTELDVEDMVSHMMTSVMGIPYVIGGDDGARTEWVADGNIDQDAIDLSARWQAAADIADAIIMETDLDDTIIHNGKEITIDEYLMQLSGDLLIHAWDLGEAIGMNVNFNPSVAAAVIEATVQHGEITPGSSESLYSSLEVPENADLQTRLLALFGRSRAWRATS